MTAPVAPPGGGRGGGSGEGGGDGGMDRDAAFDLDGGFGDASVDPLAPVVEIMDPEAATNPNDDNVLIEDDVTVVCRVAKASTDGARDVDTMSVRIELIAPDAEAPVEGVVRALTDNRYEATFALGELPNGPVQFVCAAEDVGDPPRTGMAVVPTYLDLGPSIEILDPADGESYALRNPVVIRYEVAEQPVSLNDREADIDSIRLFVIDQELEATEDPDQRGLYTLSVNFDNRTLFPMRPETAEIVIRASNSRTPVAPEREKRIRITIDAEGPTIAVTQPQNLQIVRGQVTVAATITDPSGVQEDSVSGEINDQTFSLNNWTRTNDDFTTQFDTRASIFDNLTQLTINISATDQVGNETTVPHVLRLDNLPPRISLDPPDIREWRNVNDVQQCSHPFDPVGSDSVSDLEKANIASLYRAMVLDETNHAPGANVSYHAGVDEGSVELFAQADPTIPLIIDTNEDGLCDEINSELLPPAQRPTVLSLGRVNPRGTAHYGSTATFDDVEIVSGSCSPGNEDPPDPLCGSTTMTRSITQLYIGPDNAGIFAFAPTNDFSPTGLACDGLTWEALPVLGEGWRCLAVRAEDTIDNVGVSRPLRVCFDNGQGEPPACVDDLSATGTDVASAPSCTDGCTLPDEFPTGWVLQAQ